MSTGGGADRNSRQPYDEAALDRVERAVVITDTAGVIQAWNVAAEKLYGWAAEEVRGRHVIDVLGEGPRPAEAHAALDELARGTPRATEFTVRHRDGHALVVDVVNVPLMEGGQVVAFAGFSSDRTSQRALEAQLRASRERLEMTTAQGRVGTWRTNILTGRTSWDAGLEQIFGLEPGSFGGGFEDFMAVVHPDDRAALSAEVRAAIDGGDNYVLEHRAVVGGDVRWIEGRGRVIRDEEGHPRHTVGVAIDVTERKRAELALAGQSSRLRRLGAASLALGSTLAIDEIVALVTSETREILGVSEARTKLSSDDGSPAPPDDGWLAVPMTGRGGVVLGTIEVGPRPEGAFGQDDLAVLVQLAQIAASAVENAHSYARERSAAQSLQRRLLQSALPSVPGLDLAARYVPAGELDVGGDWYDVLDLGRGRVAIAVGDVMGRGVEAASVMGQVRVGLRAYTLEQLAPSEVLSRLGRLVASLETESFSTLVLGVIDLDRSTLSWATAGHPPPLVRHADGRVVVLAGTPSPPVGVEGDRPTETCVSLEPGDILVAYTDGLVERQDLPITDGIARLSSHLAAAPAGSVSDVVEHLLQLAEGSDDDVAILAARVERAGTSVAPVASFEWSYPAVATSARAAREAVAAALGELSDRGPLPVHTAELVVAELATNAILHARTPFVVRVMVREAGVRIEVFDHDLHLPAVRRFSRMATSGRGLRLVELVSERLGAEPSSDGKVVWAELALDADLRPAAAFDPDVAGPALGEAP